MYFTPQQQAGGPRFAHKTRVGNWNEDWEQTETKLKDYLKKKQTGALLVDRVQDKLAVENQRVSFSLHMCDLSFEFRPLSLLERTEASTQATVSCSVTATPTQCSFLTPMRRWFPAMLSL